MVSWWLRRSRIHLQEIQVWSLELGRPQCSCLENSMDGRAWQATVHGVAESNMPEWQHFHFPGGKVPKLTNKAHKKLHFSLLIALRKETCVKDGKKAQNIFFFSCSFPPLNLVLQVETMTQIVHHISFLLPWAHCKPHFPAFPVVSEVMRLNSVQWNVNRNEICQSSA